MSRVGHLNYIGVRTLRCDERSRYAITLAEILYANVTLHKLVRSICRTAVYSLPMAVDLKHRGPNRVKVFCNSSDISTIVLEALYSDIITFMRLLKEQRFFKAVQLKLQTESNDESPGEFLFFL